MSDGKESLEEGSWETLWFVVAQQEAGSFFLSLPLLFLPFLASQYVPGKEANK